MSASKQQTDSSGTADIQWHRLNDFSKKHGASSGVKIECSMSDEIDFARKLALKIRKKSMRKLFEKENNMFQEELNRIGFLYTHDTVCEELKVCNREQVNKRSRYNNINQKSSLTKLFKMLEN